MGLKIFTKGVVIVGFSDIEDINGNIVSLNKLTNLKQGEKILEVNDEKINSIDDLKKVIFSYKDKNLRMKIEDSFGVQRYEDIKPIHDSSNSYKLGLWVKDAATGVGTLSFYIPKTNQFVALGHGITDNDTNSLLEIENGNLTTTKIISITKGTNGKPGEIRGTVNNDNIGEITVNSNFGIFGNLSEEKALEYKNEEKYEVGLRYSVKLGEAKIISNFSRREKRI